MSLLRKAKPSWILGAIAAVIVFGPPAARAQKAGPVAWQNDLAPIGPADWNNDFAAHLLERAAL